MSIGDGRLLSSPAEADRSRRCACAARPHLQSIAVIEPGDRAATRADRGYIDERAENGTLRYLRLAALENLAALDDGHVVRGTTNVRADDVLIAEAVAEKLGAHHTAGGSRHQRADRLLASRARID